MKSIEFSQLSAKDIDDPLLKVMLADITTLLKAELLQEVKSNKFNEEINATLLKKVDQRKELEKNSKQKLLKLEKLLDTSELHYNLEKLGAKLNDSTPISKQINYEHIFKHLSGKERIVNSRLKATGNRVTVPFSLKVDENTTRFIENIKRADGIDKKYADYLSLIDQEKLLELYERELGNIANKHNFLAQHTPSSGERAKMEKMVYQNLRGNNDKDKYINSELNLYITRVLCVDETDHEGGWPFEGEWIANDRIDLSAVSVSPDGDSSLFGPRMVSDNFEDGRLVNWRRKIATYDLQKYALDTYPLNFGTTLTIAEIDYGGGFGSTMRDIFNTIKAGVVKLVGEIGKVIGAIFGASEVGKIIGTVIGELLVLGLGEIINIIDRAVQDDVFTPQVAAIQLDTQVSTFTGIDCWTPGPLLSPGQRMNFSGFKGYYSIFYQWEIIRKKA